MSSVSVLTIKNVVLSHHVAKPSINRLAFLWEQFSYHILLICTKHQPVRVTFRFMHHLNLEKFYINQSTQQSTETVNFQFVATGKTKHTAWVYMTVCYMLHSMSKRHIYTGSIDTRCSCVVT